MDDIYLDIIWDMDGVLADFTYAFKRFVRDKCGLNIPVSTVGGQKQWQFRSMCEDETADAWKRVGRGDFNWGAMPSLLSHSDHIAMDALHQAPLPMPVRFQYVTSRFGPDALGQTQRWLAANDLHDAENVTVSQSKVSAIREAGFNPVALIDDDIRNIVAYGAAFGDQKTYVCDRQYNRYPATLKTYGLLAPETHAAWFARRVSSVAEFCYAALETLDGVDRG